MSYVELQGCESVHCSMLLIVLCWVAGLENLHCSMNFARVGKFTYNEMRNTTSYHSLSFK